MNRMKATLKLLAALLLAPLAAHAQAKPEVANAAKAAKPAWMSEVEALAAEINPQAKP
jgi:hypothetical protein